MKEPTKKEYNRQLTDKFILDQFSSYLVSHPGKRTEAALYAAGSLQALLLASTEELPHYKYKNLIRKLKG